MTSYTLMIDKNDEKLTWARFPDDLWLIILKGFLSKEANRIALETIAKADDIDRIAPIHEIKTKHVVDCELSLSWIPASGLQQTAKYDLALFHYDVTVQILIEMVKFSYWNKTSDDYPSDKLYFFHDEILLLEADSLESTLSFPDLSESQLDLLKSLDPRIPSNLHERTSIETKLQCIATD